MLTSLYLESFKGISDGQRIDFAPLTLLFGPNSGGKSTILQALLYLHELITHGSADVDRTELGGTVLELGGFARLVHRHELDRAIVLRAEFATPGGLERFGRNLTHFPFPDLDDDVESAWLELTVRMRTTASFHGPLVDRAVIGVGGCPEPLVWLETGASLREGDPLYARVNLGHPILGQAGREFAPACERIAVPEHVLLPSHPAIDPDDTTGDTPPPRTLLELHDAHLLPLFAVSRSRLCALPPVDEPLRILSPGDDDVTVGDDDTTAIIHELRTFLEMVVLGTTAQLAAALQSALYVGPLRTVPPRGFLYERPGRITSWADGLAAWDLLLADRSDLVARTNEWLKRLGAGCQVVVQQLFDPTAAAEELSVGNVDRTARRLLLKTDAGSLVLPSEVGSGVSQMLPVIVAALHARAGLVEQPELHVHPAVQVGLGDLFIEAALRDGGRHPMLVETHSEHLILRILRRIRQTSGGELPQGAPAFSPEQLNVLFVDQGPYGVRIYRLRVDEGGDFRDRWPYGFFAERREELL
jgi:AAA domain